MGARHAGDTLVGTVARMARSYSESSGSGRKQSVEHDTTSGWCAPESSPWSGCIHLYLVLKRLIDRNSLGDPGLGAKEVPGLTLETPVSAASSRKTD